MSAVAPAREPRGSLATLNFPNLALRLIVIGIADVFALLLAVSVIGDGNWFLGITIIVTALGLSYINLNPHLWPLRWMTPALGFVALLVIYPMLYTLYVAFTNYSDGHRYTKVEAVELMADTLYLPEGEASYSWEVFRDEAGTYGLWLSSDDGQTFFAIPDQPLIPVSGDVPDAYEGYTRLDGGERFRALSEIQDMTFGDPENPIGIASRTQAGLFRQKWVFDEAQNALIDRESGTVYAADDTIGNFVAPDGSIAPNGYWVGVGFNNFTRIINSPVISGPLVRVFAWTFAFSFFSVFTSFALGLFVALILNRGFPGVRIVRSMLLIPYAIPGMISILIWRGMLNPNLGVITTNIEKLFGWAPAWQSDPGWAKVAILIVNLWLTFPYFMLICSGALQAIPDSIYEAAEVDGA
ncbi:MAG: ABC transporter permease subunit, partial [Anaerolinea sp.]|nr:ABC transporter permease subunit [Anaerolinea sp.]